MNVLITTSSFGVNNFPKELNVIYNKLGRRLKEEEILELIEKYQPVGIIAGLEPLTRKVLEKAKKLKVISRCGIGLDNIDLKAAEELGMKIRNTPDAPTISVAELTMGLILCLARKINIFDVDLKKGLWKIPDGTLIKDKTLGIIGCGRIGTYVGKLGIAFGCVVIGYDPYIDKHSLFNMVNLDELLTSSDIITIHVPYTKENHHMIGENELRKMKKSAFLINTARGGLIDEDALYNVLLNKEIYGAALDCFQEEPYMGKLRELDNVILTPHIGSGALEARTMMERQALDNLLQELKIMGIV